MNNIKEQILDWLQSIEKEEGIPSHDIIAFNFGLIEAEEGYFTYLIGAKEYSEIDDDWACEEDFSPARRYLKLPIIRENYNWEKTLILMNKLLSEMLEEGMFKNTFLDNAPVITTGFDEGDLIRIK